MKLAIAATLAALAFTGCEESIEPIEGTASKGKLPQVLVSDRDGKLDSRIINDACRRNGLTVARVQRAGKLDGEGEAAVVTCKVPK